MTGLIPDFKLGKAVHFRVADMAVQSRMQGGVGPGS